MADASELIDQVTVFHADAFTWAVACCAGDGETAADVLQECYIKVATGRATFAGRSSLKTWWLSVVRLTAIEQHRGEQRWWRVVESFRDWVADLAGGSPPESTGENPVVADADSLAAALERLPARQREILHLVFQHELSVSDAAAVMRISVGSARQHYERAKKRVREELAVEARARRSDHGS